MHYFTPVPLSSGSEFPKAQEEDIQNVIRSTEEIVLLIFPLSLSVKIDNDFEKLKVSDSSFLNHSWSPSYGSR